MTKDEANELAAVIEAIGSEQLGPALDAWLRSKLTFDMSCAYLFQFNQPALLVHNGYNRTVTERTLNAYVRGGYLLDPFYVACVNEHPSGLWRMSELAPDCFFSSGFAISKDIHPCVSSDYGTAVDEVGFIIPLRPQLAIVYSLMRNHGSGDFDAGEMELLAAMSPLLASVFGQHCRLRYADILRAAPEGVVLEDAFVEILQGQLTETQRLIAKLLLQGHSNASIARQLNISDGTVKVHKHNIYQRLEISSNAELFRLFIDYLAKG
ncbi:MULTISPECIES: helix-turn-helix transcriptional regulator [Pseudomonas]|uniref:helix-turn-helix transcriptional regulator n=1 Tax=Pseudomonas TaxID=286 RepID=UPI00159E3D49|nr:MULTISPECIES: LuxR family transcriptional regulator [Pseudomonas]MBP2272053.1 DNA-binding CsgD family transcriptional regulator [Pseudomonas sp. BP6]MBP2288976.1 DNA-binding CsgD family transcriptional regulator [Pseudomonas sp. BP7]NVN62040.1 LuxR family transcriptional regulator [Pseudomonas putida]NVN67033.1 LuxR family transcriptional regulator [Pseudomonas putida]HDS1697134.1 LuxR family transcriptional regulator [Pseudomonas putida]